MAGTGYDVIGDIHGQADKLERLLARLGYSSRKGAWRHPERTAVFLGDLVDRGPERVRTCGIVRAMVDAGAGLVAMGNHEFNAIAFATEDGRGGHCRDRTPKNVAQHAGFLAEVGVDSALHRELVGWFLELPLWLDLDGIRVVHACWDEASMAILAPSLRQGARLDEELVRRASDGRGNSWRADGTRPGSSPEFQAVETLLKGVEVELPAGTSFHDADGHERTTTRVRWWDGGARTYGEAAMLPGSVDRSGLGARMPDSVPMGYDDDRPLFLGHYWMTDEPTLLAPRVACVDYSAGRGGPLVAYRWSGERTLAASGFVSTA